eukprot:CAMPEP_0201542486 /NCGR_PEP_ID=MMETSP0161_2-20130828/72066_1 /ASSEMBLY_ACC=CAM_ASM_000251 /TAXON_ID=180227 /ORGANISM="Neoparamoeba aestuarina, Strain SoJaBio B1-5/56/2" /LENGTH=226 /DNA_ID=CAMNT_0047950147 /DNA_START=651 /DNA_END=1328 /DNA_ORIENTATION=+
MTASIQNIVLDMDYPAITPTQIGYCGLPMGIGTFFGSIMGGFLAQRGYMWRGDGGRLLPAYIVGVLTAFTIVAYSNFIETHLITGLTLSGLIGLLVPASRPGMYALAIGQNPEESSSITGLLHVMQFGVTVPLSVGGPAILTHWSLRILYLIPASCIVISIIPLGAMVGKALKEYRLYQKTVEVAEDSEDSLSYDGTMAGAGWEVDEKGSSGEYLGEYDPVPSPLT